jgi:hypothetical protein
MTKRVTPLFAVVAIGLGANTAEAERAVSPRTLPSGAPAVGNTQIKGRAEPVVAVEPRTLPTGAPACGNVLSKVDNDVTDPLYQSCVRGEQPARLIVNKMVIGRLIKLLGITQTTIAPAEPRRLRTGAPANGNVARRTAPRVEREVEPASQVRHND